MNAAEALLGLKLRLAAIWRAWPASRRPRRPVAARGRRPWGPTRARRPKRVRRFGVPHHGSRAGTRATCRARERQGSHSRRDGGEGSGHRPHVAPAAVRSGEPPRRPPRRRPACRAGRGHHHATNIRLGARRRRRRDRPPPARERRQLIGALARVARAEPDCGHEAAVIGLARHPPVPPVPAVLAPVGPPAPEPSADGPKTPRARGLSLISLVRAHDCQDRQKPRQVISFTP